LIGSDHIVVRSVAGGVRDLFLPVAGTDYSHDGCGWPEALLLVCVTNKRCIRVKCYAPRSNSTVAWDDVVLESRVTMV